VTSPSTFQTLFCRPPIFVRHFSSILDYWALLKTIPPKSGAFFNSVLNVIHVIHGNTESATMQSQLLHWFAFTRDLVA
jgi:hypothetical protein